MSVEVAIQNKGGLERRLVVAVRTNASDKKPAEVHNLEEWAQTVRQLPEGGSITITLAPALAVESPAA